MATRKEAGTRPTIATVSPTAALAGGEVQVRGHGFAQDGLPIVSIGDEIAPLVIGSDTLVIAKIPDAATSGDLIVSTGDRKSEAWECQIGIQVADSLHPVSNPAVDQDGNLYSTFSGSRGQKAPVSVYKVDANYSTKPFVTDIMNATGLAFDKDGLLYASSRYDGIIYQITPTGNMSVYVEGMGVATGIAFDQEENLYVGDRSGTIFKISRSRQIYVFATIEPSIAAYHLAFGPDDYLYVTGPTTSSADVVHRVSKAGAVETFYRGLGRPQGIAFDAQGRLYVAASLKGRRGVVRIDGARNAELFLSGSGIVGVAFSPSRAMILATNSALYRVDVDIAGRPLW